MLINLGPPHFEINPLTMAVLAERGNDNEIVTRILEEDEEFVINQSPFQLINDACKYFGSSLKGRQEGSRRISGISHKIPISIDPSSGMYFFPTASPKNPYCSWIAHSHINKVNKTDNYRTKIIFKNDKSLKLDVSYGTILNQVQRTAQYRYLLDKRIKYLQQQTNLMVAEPLSLDFE